MIGLKNLENRREKLGGNWNQIYCLAKHLWIWVAVIFKNPSLTDSMELLDMVGLSKWSPWRNLSWSWKSFSLGIVFSRFIGNFESTLLQVGHTLRWIQIDTHQSKYLQFCLKCFCLFFCLPSTRQKKWTSSKYSWMKSFCIVQLG